MPLSGLVLGLCEIADGINALIYLGRGDYINAGLSAAAILPLGGTAIAGMKLAGKAAKEGAIIKQTSKKADYLFATPLVVARRYDHQPLHN